MQNSSVLSVKTWEPKSNPVSPSLAETWLPHEPRFLRLLKSCIQNILHGLLCAFPPASFTHPSTLFSFFYLLSQEKNIFKPLCCSDLISSCKHNMENKNKNTKIHLITAQHKRLSRKKIVWKGKIFGEYIYSLLYHKELCECNSRK